MTQSLFLLGFLSNSDNTTPRNKKSIWNKEPTSVFEIITKYLHKNIVIPLLCQCGLFTHACVSINSFVSKDAVFYLLWHNAIWWSSLTKCDKVECDEKSHYASDIIFEWPLCFFSCFIFILFYINRKQLLTRNLATVLILKSKLSGKSQRFNFSAENIDGSIKMPKNSWISKNLN